MRGLLAVVVCGLLCYGAPAQTAIDGAIVGRVVDTTALPRASVRVRIVSAASPHDALPARSVEVDASGSFSVLRLLPGSYWIQVSGPSAFFPKMRVEVGGGDVVEVTLREQGAPVTAGANGMVIAGDADILAGSNIEQLPLEDRRWEAVAALSSAVDEVTDESVGTGREEQAEADRSESRRSTRPLLSFRGIAPTQNVTLLDGVSSDQAFRGGTRGGASGGVRASSTFAEGAVGRFRVAPHGYSAQYGGGAGGVVSAVTRPAGALHGGGFFLLRTAALAAANPFSVVSRYRDGVITTSVMKPQDLDRTVGARVSGPVFAKRWHDRLSGSLTVEEQWRDYPAVSSPASPAFYALTAGQVALLGNRGVTAAARNAALNYLDTLTGELPRSATRELEFGRADVRLGERDSLAVSYARTRLSSPAGSGSGPSLAVVARGRASVGDGTVQVDAVTGRWLHLFAAGLTNEVRAQFSRDLEYETPRMPLPQEPAIGPGGYAPQVRIGGIGNGEDFRYGTPAGLGRRAYPDEERVQVADVAQWAPRGRGVRGHLFTVGGDWSRINERVDALTNTEGSFNYESGATNGRAGGLVDWITDYTFNVNAYPNGGCPSINAPVHLFCFRSFTQSFGREQNEFVLHEFAGFAQDLWRVRAGLTVELGARYEYLLLPLPQAPNFALDATFRSSGTTSIFPEDRNNVGPRVSVAWSPHEGRWGSVHAGYGLYFGRLPGSTVRAALLDTALPSTVTRIRIAPDTVTVCPQVANQGFGYPCAYLSAPPAAVAATTSATVFARNFRLPAVQQAELTLERAWHGVSARATYSAAWGTQLPNSVDINIAPATQSARFVLQGGAGQPGVRSGDAFSVPLYTARVASQFGPVSMLESNANATWHGLTLDARGKLASGLAFHTSYTFSKALDFGAEQGTVPRVNGQFDPFNVRIDKGRAEADVPHRFTGNLLWQTKLQSGPRSLRTALTGWHVSALAIASSGRPYSYEIFGGTRLSGGTFSINGAGGSAYLPTVGRNTLRLPPRWNVDARIARGFRVKGTLRGEGYAEVFNVANHTNPARVNARAFLVGTAVNGVTPLVFQDAAAIIAEGLNTSPFGTVTSSSTGSSAERHLQAGIRLDF